MQVRYERPMPDLTHTVAAPLLLDIGGQHGLEVERWSLDGLHPPAALRGTGGAAWLTIPYQGFGITLGVNLRRDPETGLMRFERLGVREARVLQHVYRALISGRAVAMDRIITAMDTPVEPVPMAQTPAESVAQSRASLPRPLRIAAALAFWGVMSVFAYGPLIEPLAREARAQMAQAPEVDEP